MSEDSQQQELVYNSDCNIKSKLRNVLDEVVSFSGVPQYFAVGFVDIVNSTNITANLSLKKASLYYSTFLNSMSIIVKASDGIVMKNIGDSLMFYFHGNKNYTNNQSFANIVECGMNMINVRDVINERLFYFDLPELNYRISADYGCVLVADSKTTFDKDLFGSPVNTCARINHLAFPNTMVIGQNLYQQLKFNKLYDFEKINTCILLAKKRYDVYEVKKIKSKIDT